MIAANHPDVDRVMAETGMDRIQAWRHVQQRAALKREYQDGLRARADASVAAFAAAQKAFTDSVEAASMALRGFGSIANVIALEHAAGDEAHVTGMPLERCQRYVRRNAVLVAGLKKGGAA